MNDDDIDLPEPEHEHLLDHEFDDLPDDDEHDATGLQDALEEDEADDWDEDDSDAHLHDD